MSPENLPLGMVRLMRNYSTYSAIVAGVIVVWAWLGWGFPFVMSKEYTVARAADQAEVAHKFEQLGGRVERLENEVTKLSTAVLEGQELQLMGLLKQEAINNEMKLRLEQQLSKVRREIERRTLH